MRKFLIAGALAAVALTQAQPSEASFRGKWCAKQDIGGGTATERCDFPTYGTCYRYIASMPGRSFCIQNQWRAGNWGIDEDLDGNRFNMRYR
ncbi:MAG: hypothetical protein FJX62_03780 [Alphaproteobacteria bacterium]|nr:hypothetical protein [Alphaproteobacteria bacterium]